MPIIIVTKALCSKTSVCVRCVQRVRYNEVPAQEVLFLKRKGGYRMCVRCRHIYRYMLLTKKARASINLTGEFAAYIHFTYMWVFLLVMYEKRKKEGTQRARDFHSLFIVYYFEPGSLASIFRTHANFSFSFFLVPYGQWLKKWPGLLSVCVCASHRFRCWVYECKNERTEQLKTHSERVWLAREPLQCNANHQFTSELLVVVRVDSRATSPFKHSIDCPVVVIPPSVHASVCHT